MLRKELQKAESAEVAAASEEVIYKIDIPANRYDMLCLEGIARALNVFLGRIPPPTYTLADMAGRPLQRMVVRPETALVRPFVVAAVLRGVAFDPLRYNSFIDLQARPGCCGWSPKQRWRGGGVGAPACSWQPALLVLMRCCRGDRLAG